MKECGLHSGNLTEEQKAKQDAREATEEDIFTGGAVAAMTREEIEALNDEDVHEETTLAVLYAPWCPFCQAMQDGFEAAAERLAPKGVKVTKFRADGDQKEWCKETLSLASFPTVLLFPEGTQGLRQARERAPRPGLARDLRHLHRRPALRKTDAEARGKETTRERLKRLNANESTRETRREETETGAEATTRRRRRSAP